MIGVSRATVYRWAKLGILKLHRKGTMTFIRTEDAIEAIERLGGQLGDQPP